MLNPLADITPWYRAWEGLPKAVRKRIERGGGVEDAIEAVRSENAARVMAREMEPKYPLSSVLRPLGELMRKIPIIRELYYLYEGF